MYTIVVNKEAEDKFCEFGLKLRELKTYIKILIKCYGDDDIDIKREIGSLFCMLEEKTEQAMADFNELEISLRVL